MMKKMMGFTLAEVLTTLMVIGVVAAMTIPTLMNSTNDQQLKVAYKKAMSILSQGTQLMVAKEVECFVSDDESLASCFGKNVLSGNQVGYDNKNQTSGAKNNVIVTADGIAYAFYYFGDQTKYKEGSGVASSLEDICGTMSDLDSATTPADAYNGKQAKCAVVVDVNGFSKGAKTFRQSAKGQNSKTALDTNFTNGAEQQPVIITGNGVRAVYAAGQKYGNGYEWMYGTTVKPYSGN